MTTAAPAAPESELVRVKMLTGASGPTEILRVGETYLRPRSEAEAWQRIGACVILPDAEDAEDEKVEASQSPRNATQSPRRNAAKPASKPRKTKPKRDA